MWCERKISICTLCIPCESTYIGTLSRPPSSSGSCSRAASCCCRQPSSSGSGTTSTASSSSTARCSAHSVSFYKDVHHYELLTIFSGHWTEITCRIVTADIDPCTYFADSIILVSCIFSSLVVAKSARECHFLSQVKWQFFAKIR